MNYSELISSVQIEGIRIVEGSIRTKINDAEGHGELVANLGHGVKLIEPLHERLFAYRVSFRFIVTTKATSEKVTPPDELAAVRVSFQLAYKLPDDSGSPSHDVLEEFGRNNAVFNAWPYWREFLQSSLARMSLPSFILPVLRVPQEADKEGNDGSTEQPEGTLTT